MKTLKRKEYTVLLELLYQIRVNSGLRQADLAIKLNCPQSYISKVESGERRIDLIELMDICHALDVDIKDFIAKLSNNIKFKAN
ncbi:MAG: helix-turn-helix transcriptional regulator [Segetibacter sp.]